MAERPIQTFDGPLSNCTRPTPPTSKGLTGTPRQTFTRRKAMFPACHILTNWD